MRNSLFLRTPAPVPLGREIRVDLIMPSGTVVSLDGRVARHVAAGERGAGLDLVLTKLPPSALWMIESALAKAAPEEVADGGVVEDRESAAAEQELSESLAAELRAFRSMTALQVLGLAGDADEPTARAAFGVLSKKYHPDRFARYESERLRGLSAEIFMFLREAYRQVAEGRGRSPVRPGGTPAQGVPLVGRGLTPAQGVPIMPAAGRAGTPIQGVPIQRGASPGEGPAPRRAPDGPAPSPTPTPAQGIPVRRPTPIQGIPIAPLPGPPSAPRLPTPAQGIPVYVPPPADTSRPVVTFNRAEPGPGPAPTRGAPGPAAPGAKGLSHDDLFGDLEDIPAPAATAAPLALGEPGITEADSLLSEGRYDEAINGYDAILRRNPTDRAARSGRELGLGLKLLAVGDRVGAAERFEAALEIEPWSERAARELATLRRSATERGKGLLAKLLGKGGS